MMSKKQCRRIARRALARDRRNPVTHTGRLLHPLGHAREVPGGPCFDAEHVQRDPETRKVLAFLPIDMFEGPPRRGYLTQKFVPGERNNHRGSQGN